MSIGKSPRGPRENSSAYPRRNWIERVRKNGRVGHQEGSSAIWPTLRRDGSWFSTAPLSLPWPVVDMSQFSTFINTRDDDRRFSAERYGDIDWLHLRFSEACEAAATQVEKLENENSIDKSLLFVFSDSSVVGTSEERSVDLWNRCMKCHPDGFTIDADYAHGFRITPLATLRHVLWDDLIHLRSIRLHRKALGLSPVYPDVPVGGYTSAYPIY